MKILHNSLLFLLLCICSSASFASDINFNDTTSQIAPLNNPDFTGNVGIDSASPGQTLDVQGTTRSTNVTVTSIASGTQCVQANSSGVFSGTGSACSGANYWHLAGGTGNVGINTTNTVGIGTTSGIGSGLIVMNGNVGIGTWVPADLFQVGHFSSSSSGFEVDTNGNVGIGTLLTSASALSIMNGNFGIGLDTPASSLDITPPGGTNFIHGQGSSVGWSIVDGSAEGSSNYAFWLSTSGNGLGVMSANGQPLEIVSTIGSATCVVALLNPAASFQLAFGSDSGFDSNFYFNDIAGGNASIDIGNGNGTWDNLQMASAVMGLTYASSEFTPPANGLLVQGNVGIGTYNINTGLDIVGNVGIGTGMNTPYVTTTPPSGGMIVQGNVGIGTWAPEGSLVVVGNVGIGSVAPSHTLVLGSASSQSGTAACWGTNGCIGYCTVGIWPNCSTCTCL